MSASVITEEYECDEIPVIDLCLFKDGIDDHDRTESEYIKVRKACEEWGCFLVVNHGLKEEVICDMDSAVRDVFKLFNETLQKNVLSGKELGYIPSTPAMPFYQGLAIHGADDPREIQKFSDTLWPQGNTKICKVIHAYTSGVTELAINIIKVIFRGLGVSKYQTSAFWGFLRMNYYDIPPNEAAGMVTHIDYNCITVLYQDDMGGLQVKSKGGKWVYVKPVVNSFIVMLGECFKAWSNGRTYSVPHRVIMEGCDESKCRLSLPYFYGFPLEAVVDALPELVDDDHPRLYRPFLYGELREFCVERKKMIIQRKDGFRAETAVEAHLDTFFSITTE